MITSERMEYTIEVMQRTYMHLFPGIQDEIVQLLDNLIWWKKYKERKK